MTVSPAPIQPIPPPLRLPARVITVILAVLMVGLFVAAIPVRYADLLVLCDVREWCPALYLSSTDLVALEQLGLSLSAYAAYQTGLEVVAVSICIALGIFIFRYHSHTWMGLLTTLLTIQMSIVMMNIVWTFFQVYEQYALLGEILTDSMVFLLLLFLFMFPNGRIAPDWAKWVIGFGVVFQLFTLVNVNAARGWLYYAASVGSITVSIIAVFVQIYRYCRILTSQERQQVKWVLVAIGIFVFGIINWMLTMEFFPFEPGSARVYNYIFNILIGVMTIIAIPVAIAVAMLRYRLWDVDVIINRTLVYTILTVLVIGIYALVVGVISSTLRAENNLIGSMTAAGVVAVSFQGLRERVQWTINRLMFGQRDNPPVVLLALSQQLSKAVLPQELLQGSAETIAQTLKLPYVAIAIRRGEHQAMQTAYGTNNTTSQTFALVYQNEVVGDLIVGQRSPNEPLNPADQKVLAGIAQQMGAVVYAVRLQSELQQARERLVIAREEERRRIRRDLHDGLGPALASQTLKLDTAIDLFHEQSDHAYHLLVDIQQQFDELIADVRRLVHDLRPPALDELGLIGAVRSAATQLNAGSGGTHINIDAAPSLPEFSAAVEVAAYRIIMEAITNVLKHAHASQCRVMLNVNDNKDELRVQISDNGTGLPDLLTSGVGLQSMRERAEELGGRLQITSTDGTGTQVTAHLPLSKEQNPA